MGDMTNHLIRYGEGRFEAAVRGRLDDGAGGKAAGAK
jgi:hypothetical protein